MTKITKGHSEIVVWQFSSYNNYGDPIVSSPIRLTDVRWEQEKSELLDSDNKPISIDVTAYTQQAVAIGSIIWKGELSSLPNSPTPLYYVQDYNEIPDIKGHNPERKLSLKRYTNTLPTIS